MTNVLSTENQLANILISIFRKYQCVLHDEKSPYPKPTLECSPATGYKQFKM